MAARLRPVRCLVIHAHPDPESFSTRLRERAVAGLERADHHVDVIDLYGERYQPCMSAAEHVDYDTIGADHPDPVVRHHIGLVSAAEALVFIYPTWWSGVPAILKGWLERTFLPGVAFTLHPGADGKAVVGPNLQQVRRLVGITTYGSKRLEVRLLGDGGRRTVTRTVRVLCHPRCKTTWLSMHSLDTAGDPARFGFLDRVEATMADLT